MWEYNEISYQNPDGVSHTAELSPTAPELQAANEILHPTELTSYSEHGDKSSTSRKQSSDEKGEKQKKSVAKLLTGFVTSLVATVTIGVTLVAPIKDNITPAHNASVSVLELAALPTAIHYAFEVTGDAPLEVVLENDSTHRRLPMEGEHNVGAFENLQYGMTYELSVVGKGLLSDTKLFSQSLTLPHPVEMAYVSLSEHSLDGDTLYCTLWVDCETPLYAVLSDGTTQERRPLVNEENQISFPNLNPAATYELTVVGTGLYGKEMTVFHTTLYPFGDPEPLP